MGAGALPDAGAFGDNGADTLGNIYRTRPGLDLPNLCALGLGRVAWAGCGPERPMGCFGKMAEQSAGKDTLTGHWEIAGVITRQPFPTYPQGFPRELIRRIENELGVKTLGNYPASGTAILDELGPEHLRTGFPIVYTSADSVFQMAAHEEVIPLELLHDYCARAREILTNQHNVARVIARPFVGEPGNFRRNNAGRRDYAVEPPGNTLMNYLNKAGIFTIGIGKIGSIFNHRWFSREIPTRDNQDGMDQVLSALEQTGGQAAFIFANLVDFDTVYGHRRDVAGYAQALEEFDAWLPKLMETLGREDILMISADHGCDPTFSAHTDHTREYVPLLVYGKALRQGGDLGVRTVFADCGQTIADIMGAGPLANGTSFKQDLGIDD